MDSFSASLSKLEAIANTAFRLILLSLLLVLVNFSLKVNAQTWPSKPVKLIVGFSAGGPTDLIARGFGDYAAHELGQPLIIDNKPGANTIIAAEAVASSNDGHTLLIAATNHTMIPALYQSRVKFDAIKSFKPICTFAIAPTVLVIRPSLKIRTLTQFIQYAKNSPNSLTYGTPGIGSSVHFASESFTKLAGIKLTHIPYKGASQVISDLLANQLDASFASLGSVLQQIKSGRLIALAIASPERSSLLPEIPTFKESGLGKYSADAWYGMLAPANIPSDVLQTLEKVALAYVALPSTHEKLHLLGLEPQAICGAAFAKQITSEVKMYSQLAKQLNLTIE